MTAYGIDLYGDLILPQLLRKLCGVEGIRWIRLLYCYEDEITEELIETIRSEEKICNYLDIPLQHVSDSVLSDMNRHSTSQSIRETIQRLRAEIPDIHIRTTFIAGFPGESEEDFEELADFVETVKFDRMGVFAYSQEENTLAAEMKHQIDEETKIHRRDTLMEIQREVFPKNNLAKSGRCIRSDRRRKRRKAIPIWGRTRFDAPEIDNGVIFTSERELIPGEYVYVEITDAFDYDLSGRETAAPKQDGDHRPEVV